MLRKWLRISDGTNDSIHDTLSSSPYLVFFCLRTKIEFSFTLSLIIDELESSDLDKIISLFTTCINVVFLPNIECVTSAHSGLNPATASSPPSMPFSCILSIVIVYLACFESA